VVLGLNRSEFGALLQSMKRADTYRALPASFDVMLLCHDNDRGIERNGRAYSQILDPVGDILEHRGYSVASVATRGSRLIGDLAHRSPASLNRAMLLASLTDRLSRRRSADQRLKATETMSRIERFWDRLLSSHRPRVLVGVSIPPALCRAASRLGVITIETMHGFGLPSDDYVHGSSARSSKESSDEPDVYIVYDRLTRDTIADGLKGDRTSVLLAQAPLLSAAPEPAEKLDILTRLLGSEVIRHRTYDRVVLLTLQHGYDGEREYLNDIIDNGILHPDFEQVMRIDPRILWLIKLHPVQLRGASGTRATRYLSMLSDRYDNIEWENTSRAPLSELLSVSDSHITMSSGTVYEAAMLGVRSVAYCPTLRQGGFLESYFEDLVAEGYVTKEITEPGQLHEWIRQATRIRRRIETTPEENNESLPATADLVERFLKST
jgi:hypothetical protein